ncbi:MAG TPA: nucleotidyl transferase AbiEii/AbiGii toxin family protein [Kofleriaceae bacterium]|nr:nucleotidyl transferase AbiEii/AbiGii toxin family protein [Kofleriaceae bacterium]
MTFTAAELEQAFSGLLADLARVLDDLGSPWMLVGGLAVGAWTEPRGTKDCDLALLVRDAPALRRELAAVGLDEARGDLDRAASGGVVRLALRRPALPRLVVDLLCAGTPFETEALQRRRRSSVFGVALPIVSPDDLLIYKLIAGRPQDLADIDKLLRFGRCPEDEAYLRRWARDWDLVPQLDAVLSAARRG